MPGDAPSPHGASSASSAPRPGTSSPVAPSASPSPPGTPSAAAPSGPSSHRGLLAPWAAHGPLPWLLLGLTVLTGVVDAVSYLALGHVFVANMTGNVVLLGFALAGGPGLSIPASLAAIALFLVGAALGGVLGRRLGHHRGRLLRTSTALGALLLAVGVLAALGADDPVGGVRRYVLIAVLAVPMGAQNAVARRLAVPDLTTTVLTLTLTGLAADAAFLGGPGGSGLRRVAAVVAMGTGALAGGLLVLQASPAAALGLAVLVAAVVAVAAHRIATAPGASWATTA